ncbi:MAG: transcriptional regulator NrdR, transcriptional repressor NrdR [Candidatus Peregrinibacteria bacterium GW2011_GWE2_39_6]|nr:MAG: transcriptional regulator NrdR, transcriptional repressor NrdR [Candidatus Peregrinibacteria bacterium GW2011_GWF2_39_17]KKR24007.1 MAG: transcriptional regulator NrdR, transcriptional repressor NrdR [Candidatus Peregrinibacteria bacterium GW2011_GWE2_39_6]HCW32378.1 transcriptional regulator NrdR [Candidatus Peregrinibacteria bacterium]
MRCPKCKKSETRVIDSRDTNFSRQIRRRRECESCAFRFTTFEHIEAAHFVVIKKDGSREPYQREKIESGIWKSCEKRPVTEAQIEALLNNLEDKWSAHGKEIPTKLIGKGIMDGLKKIDEVAYIRFASVYRQFKDVESFKKELAKLLE